MDNDDENKTLDDIVKEQTDKKLSFTERVFSVVLNKELPLRIGNWFIDYLQGWGGKIFYIFMIAKNISANDYEALKRRKRLIIESILLLLWLVIVSVFGQFNFFLLGVLVSLSWIQYQYWCFEIHIQKVAQLEYLKLLKHQGQITSYEYYYTYPILLLSQMNKIENHVSKEQIQIFWNQAIIESTNWCGDVFKIPTNSLSTNMPVNSIRDSLFELGVLPQKCDSSYFYITPNGIIIIADKLFLKMATIDYQKILMKNILLAPAYKELAQKMILKKLNKLQINSRAARIVDVLNENSNGWGFGIQRAAEFEGNSDYFKVRCVYHKPSTSITIKSKIPEIIVQTHYKTQFVPLNYPKSSFDLIFFFEEEPRILKIHQDLIQQYNDKNKILIGNSVIGLTAAQWKPGSANHMLIVAGTDSGKTVAIRSIVLQLMHFKVNPFKTIIVSSGLKVADYKALKENGAYVEAGAKSMLQALEAVWDEIQSRETLLDKVDLEVGNVTEYNKQMPTNRQLKSILLIADEYETALKDREFGKKIDNLMAQIINNARAFNVIVLISTQTPLTKTIGQAESLINTRFVGFNQPIQLQNRYPKIAKFFSEFNGDTKGLFFYSSQFLKPEKTFNYDSSNYMMVRTPYIEDFNRQILNLDGQLFVNKYLEKRGVQPENTQFTVPKEML